MALYKCSGANLVYEVSNMDIHALIDFFYFGGTDDQGRTLDSILNQTDDWLESTHDFIQWLFPLEEKSGANPSAPLVDYELLGAFRLYKVGPYQMIRALDRMLKFYGLQRSDLLITKGSNWSERKGYWYVEPTHNDLRVSRMLKSMTILEIGGYAQAFLAALLQLADERDCGFSREAIEFWKSSIEPIRRCKPIPESSKPFDAMTNEEKRLRCDLLVERLRYFEARCQAEDRVKKYFANRLQ